MWSGDECRSAAQAGVQRSAGGCEQLPAAIQLERGYILTGRDVVRDGAHLSRWPLDRAPLPLETSIPGVFAVGDARYRSIKRVASAVGDGATAVREAHEYLALEHVESARGAEPALEDRTN